MKITTIGLDIAKSIFHLYAVNTMGQFVNKKQLKRTQLLRYFARLEPCVVAMGRITPLRPVKNTDIETHLVHRCSNNRHRLDIGNSEFRLHARDFFQVTNRVVHRQLQLVLGQVFSAGEVNDTRARQALIIILQAVSQR